jgi:excinuclease ABC subunit A
LAPFERRGQEKFETVFAEIRRSGYTRVRIDNRSFDVDAIPAVDHRRKHEIEIVVDRLVIRSGQRTRIADAIEQALSLGKGLMRIAHVESHREESDWRVDRFSQHLSCDQCGRALEQLNPHNYSFNSPLGWCPSCEGLGTQSGASLDLLVRDPMLTLRDGAIAAWPTLEGNAPFLPFADALAKHGGFSLDIAYCDLEPRQQRLITFGTGDTFLPLPNGAKFQYKGLIPTLDEARRVSFVYRQRLEHLLGDVPCSTCLGARIREDAAAVRFENKTIGELCELPLGETIKFFRLLKLDKRQRQVAGELLREIENRLQFLVDVGLEYLTLSRPSPTLSGGEAQRIRLASQIGSGLTGVLYVLDEPTIGLHARDNRRLLAALIKLRNLGNTLLLVEHDREVINGADHLLDFGPGAGDRGGEIVAEGSPDKIVKAKDSLTGKYLSGRLAIPVPNNRRIHESNRQMAGKAKAKLKSGPTPSNSEISMLTVQGARHHNLKNITVSFPLGTLIAVTGVSGSGKSSLVHAVLHDTVARRLHRAGTKGAAHDAIIGLDQIDKIISVDQSPIGNTPSSNPATFTGVFDLIRELFAHLPEARIRGYQPRRFSFNKPGGRCEACEGNGQKKIEMHFLPDVWVKCDVCNGHRYNPDTLAVKYKGKSIADVLELRVGEALVLFENIPKIRRILQTLTDVGLEYVALGQPAPTLSGGEAQRVKLAAELGRPQTGRTLYVLDEPTTGLHFDDVRKLLDVLQRLVDLGNTVIVVEHNLDVIKSADWVVDLGPEAGDAGGFLVAEGPPELIAQTPNSHTGAILAGILAADPHADRIQFDPNNVDKKNDGDLELHQVGEKTTAPWETDGRRWHTKDRLSFQGRPCVWEGAALDWVEREIHKLGKFGETNWNHRTVIEIAATKKTLGYFFHGMTGGERLLRLVFRVKRNTFKRDQLDNALGIRTLNETEGVKAFGDEDRVRVANRRGPWQEVTILVHKKSEIDTPSFKSFLKKAAEAFQANIQAMQTSPEDVMPWKVNGERWHLGEKGFPPGRKICWDRQLLPKLLQIIRESVPKLEIKWDVRDAISFRADGNGPVFARWWTKRSDALECQFFPKKGTFNLSQLDRLGRDSEIQHDKTGNDVVLLKFVTMDDVNVNKVKSLIDGTIKNNA